MDQENPIPVLEYRSPVQAPISSIKEGFGLIATALCYLPFIVPVWEVLMNRWDRIPLWVMGVYSIWFGIFCALVVIGINLLRGWSVRIAKIAKVVSVLAFIGFVHPAIWFLWILRDPGSHLSSYLTLLAIGIGAACTAITFNSLRRKLRD